MLPTIVVLAVFGMPLDHINAVLIVAFVQLAYFLLLESRTGTTVGKRSLGLHVVDHYGRSPTFEAAARRNSWVVLQPFVGPEAYFAFAFIVWTGVVILIVFSVARRADHRGLHDRWAEAWVVETG